MTREQFEALNLLRKRGSLDQREVASVLNVSIGKADAPLKTFVQEGWIDSAGAITKAGLSALRPYKVDNAVIMAAGLSSRFAPLSYEKPKGLIVVKGEVLVERQIRQLREVGIQDITLVAGYLKDMFYYLEDKFDGLHVVDNDDYYRYNNTSTMVRVLDKLRNTYICSSDNYFTQNVFEPYVYSAYYAATFFPGAVNEWGIKVDPEGLIVGIDHHPVDMWCMMGHVYFDRRFSETFRGILETEYATPSVRKELWEAVYERNIENLEMSIRRYPEGIIHEFDSLDDLRLFDGSFLQNTGSGIIRSICRELHCGEADIVGIKVVNGDAADLAFSFSCKGRHYVFRKTTNTVEGA